LLALVAPGGDEIDENSVGARASFRGCTGGEGPAVLHNAGQMILTCFIWLPRDTSDHAGGSGMGRSDSGLLALLMLAW
jgi:hypothetical protein